MSSSTQRCSGVRHRPRRAWRQVRGELFALSIGLGVLLVAVKIALLPFTVSSLGELGRWVLRLGLVCSADIVFLAVVTAVFAGVARLAVRRRRAFAVFRGAAFLTFYAAGVYAVFCMALFRVTLQPFSVRMLTFVEGPLTMLDSIERYLHWEWLAALALAPPAALILPQLLRRFAWVRRGAPLGLRGAVAVIAVIVVYASVSQAYMKSQWTEPRRWERRIACNPHLVMFTSCLEELCKDESWTAIVNFGDANQQDFTSRVRPAQPAAVMNLPGFLEGRRRPKNVLVFFLESVAAEYVTLYGCRHETTPHLERLVKENDAVVFENFYVSVPYSCKSIVAASSSTYPRLDWRLIISEYPEYKSPLITQVLGERGFRTCYAHSGYWSWRHRDRFLQDRVGTLIDAEHMPEQRISSWGVADQAMFQSALDWIDVDPNKPFFLLAYTIETHHPYATPEKPREFDVQDVELKKYLNSLRATDERLAWMVRQLERRHLLDDTLIVITSDHGEAFGQHNQRSHNFGVYECNIHVPLIMIHPSLRGLPRRVKAPREQIDLAPTLLDCLGVKSPSVWQGRNLFRPDDGRPAYFFCVGNFVVLGLRDGRFKYHYYVASGEEELFDLSADPGEKENLARQHPGRCAQYRKRVGGLARFQRRFLAQQGSP